MLYWPNQPPPAYIRVNLFPYNLFCFVRHNEMYEFISVLVYRVSKYVTVHLSIAYPRIGFLRLAESGHLGPAKLTHEFDARWDEVVGGRDGAEEVRKRLPV